jgi:hypothetical protein
MINSYVGKLSGRQYLVVVFAGVSPIRRQSICRYRVQDAATDAGELRGVDQLQNVPKFAIEVNSSHAGGIQVLFHHTVCPPIDPRRLDPIWVPLMNREVSHFIYHRITLKFSHPICS